MKNNVRRIDLRGAALEITCAFVALTVAAAVGAAAGWRQAPPVPTATRIWPFYIDPSDTTAVWSIRALVPLLAIAPAVVLVHRWLRRGGSGSLIALVSTAYVFQLACGVERYGIAGLSHTFLRGQEYWHDVRYVSRGYLAMFPD